MLVPSIFSDNFADSFFDDMFRFPGFSYSGRPASSMMKTDVQDLGENYQLDIELPGFKKEDIHAELSEGYLTISAQTSSEKDEKNENGGSYVRRERYSGSCQRRFYVGGNLKEEDIHASFENGILKLVFPKEEQRKVVEQKKYIAIE